MDGEAWWAAVYGVAQSRTRLKRLSSSSSRIYKIMLSKNRDSLSSSDTYISFSYLITLAKTSSYVE